VAPEVGEFDQAGAFVVGVVSSLQELQVFEARDNAGGDGCPYRLDRRERTNAKRTQFFEGRECRELRGSQRRRSLVAQSSPESNEYESKSRRRFE
jgi:hypothetical protein